MGGYAQPTHHGKLVVADGNHPTSSLWNGALVWVGGSDCLPLTGVQYVDRVAERCAILTTAGVQRVFTCADVHGWRCLSISGFVLPLLH